MHASALIMITTCQAMTSVQRDWSVAIMALEQEENVRFENLPPAILKIF